MEPDLAAAGLAGLIAGAAMLLVRVSLRAAGLDLRMDVVRMWATIFRLRGGSGWMVGLVMHLVVSVAVGLVYAFGLRYIFNASDGLAVWGVIGGVIHYVIAGVFLTIAPDLNPEMPQRVPAPGMFAGRLGGADVAGFLAGHLAYGLAFGIAYAVLHPAGGGALVA